MTNYEAKKTRLQYRLRGYSKACETRDKTLDHHTSMLLRNQKSILAMIFDDLTRPFLLLQVAISTLATVKPLIRDSLGAILEIKPFSFLLGGCPVVNVLF